MPIRVLRFSSFHSLIETGSAKRSSLRRLLNRTLIEVAQLSTGLGPGRGILDRAAQTGPLCSTAAETIFSFHYGLIRGFECHMSPREVTISRAAAHCVMSCRLIAAAIS